MAWTLTQSKAGSSFADPGATTFDSTPATGSLLLASVYDNSSLNAPTVSDSNGNWTQLGTSTRTGNGLWLYALVAVASQPTAVTSDRSTDTQVLNLYEFAGGPKSLSSIVDKTGAATGTSATTTSGSQPSITPTGGNELVFTQLAVTGSVTSPSLSDGTFTAGKTAPAAIQLVDYYKLNAGAATYNPSFSWTTTRNWLQLTTALKGSSSGFFALF